MRLFDESTGIKHARGLMHIKRIFCLLLAGGVTFIAGAQTNTAAPDASVAPSTNAPATNVAAPDAAAKAAAEPAQSMEASKPVHTRATRSLTLDECIRLALEHNLDIQIQRYNPIIDQFNLNLYYGAYEPVGSFSASKTYNDSPGGVSQNVANVTSTNGSSQNIVSSSSILETVPLDAGIKGVLPWGLTYDVNGPLTRNTFYNQPTNGPGFFSSPFWTSGPGITLSQPLLKNFWIDNNRLQISLSKDTLKISESNLRLQIMTTVTAVKTAYYNLLYNRGNVDANATAYKLAEQLVKENVKRVEVGALAPLDEKQSESQAAASLSAMQAAEQALVVQENTLKNLLTDNYSEWTDVSLLPADQLVAVPQELNLQESWRRAVVQRPEMVRAKLNIEAQNVTLKYDLNQVFPELDVVGSYGRNATTHTIGENFADIQQGDHSFYSYGAAITVPLGGNIAARNQYRAGKATLKQLLLTLKQIEQGILVSVDNDVGAVRSSLQQVYATRDARAYAQDALAAEQKKLENGKSTSFIVLQLISNLTTARVNEVQALATYNIAVAQLAQDEGSTLDANHIDLKVK